MTDILNELGLDDSNDKPPIIKEKKPIHCKYCNARILAGDECDSCKEIRLSSSSVSSSTLRTQSLPIKKSKLTSVLLVILGSSIALTILMVILSQIPNLKNSEKATNQTSYSNAQVMEELISSINEKIGVKIFGEVSTNWGTMTVVVEDGFILLEPKAKRFAIEKLRDIWFEKLRGSKAVFKTWNGAVVAEFEK